MRRRNPFVLWAKWSIDGATTLSEAAAALRAVADQYIAMDADGWLTDPVRDDYGHIRRAPETEAAPV